MEFKTLEKHDSGFEYLIWVGACDSYGVKEVFKAMRNRPEVQSHLVSHQIVGIVKQVDITPGQGTVLLNGERGRKRVRQRDKDTL